jgi:short-subunit dehydrogenase
MTSFKGKWALVTGASAGIGVALARELAKAGANLVLTARRTDRMEVLAAELRASGVEVRIVAADLNEPAAPAAIHKATADLDIDILINNAGLGQFGPFSECGLEQELSQVRVNCEAMVHLTRLYLPAMVERKRGWVMIVSSLASYQPLPYLATYAATKAFDRFFSEALAAEVAGKGIHVTALCPGPTDSEFFVVSRAGAISGKKRQSAEQVAERGVRALARGKRTIIPYLGGKAIGVISWLMPNQLVTYFVERGTRPQK